MERAGARAPVYHGGSMMEKGFLSQAEKSRVSAEHADMRVNIRRALRVMGLIEMP